MQIIQTKYTETSVVKRIASLFLAMLMLISYVSVPELIVSAEEDDDTTGGFKLSMEWNSNDTNNAEESERSTVYRYDSDEGEERVITLKVRYSNKKVIKNDFEKGSIIITVSPELESLGFKGAVRSGVKYEADSVAADKMSSANKSHDWSYSYTKATDTYTFVNNKKIEAKSTFEGSFEIMWILPSRGTIDNYSMALEGKLNAMMMSDNEIENYEVTSNTVEYHQTRVRDEYKISETAAYLYRDEVWSGIEDPIDDYMDYIWVNYRIDKTVTSRARSIEDIYYFKCYFLEGAIVQGDDLVKTSETRNDLDEEGNTYRYWKATKSLKDSSTQYLPRVYVAYPPEYNDQKVKNYVELYGRYYDEYYKDSNDYALLDVTDGEVDLSDYWFRDIPGDIYDVEKHSHGITNSYTQNQDDELCKNYGAINASHLSDGAHEYFSTLELKLNFRDEENIIDEETGEPKINEETGKPETKKYDLVYYDLEFVDDIMDISLKTEGEDGCNMRRLTDEEYNFTHVVIPPNSMITNGNGLPIKSNTYKVEVYIRRAGEKNFPYQYLTDENISEIEPFRTTYIKTSEQKIYFPYDDVVGVKIVIRGIKEGFNTNAIKCYYKFHISDEELSNIITDNGQLINNMYFNLYKMGRSDNYEWFNNGFDNGLEDGYYSDEREFKRDLELYGHGVDRENGILHILEIPSEFQVRSVKLETTGIHDKYKIELKGSICSQFTFGEGVDLSEFSMYTIIPEDLHIMDIYKNPETIKEVLRFEANTESGLTAAYISEHTTIEIIDNYRNSGRQYLAFHYNFDEPVTPSYITVSGIPMYVNKDSIENQSKSYTMYAGMLIDQQGKWYSNSTDNYPIEGGIWSDMDNDGNITERASFKSGSVTVTNPIDSDVGLLKFVKTDKTNGFVIPDVNNPALTYADGIYTYRLRANIGETISVKDFIFFDAIENVKGYKWQGEFVDVDYSEAKKLFGGIEPTVYYSTEVETFPTKADGVYIITPETLKQGKKWTTEKPETVRSIAVYFGDDAVAKSRNSIYIDIIMKAPSPDEADKNDYYGKITINDCAVGYTKISEDINRNEVIEQQNLPSNNVRVKFIPPMGKIKLTKKDVTDNHIIMEEAKFELFRVTEDGDESVGTYTTTDGKIVANVEYGDYYFKEIEAPKGYELSEEILPVTLMYDTPDWSVDTVFENERKDGTITIKKVSDRNKTLPLTGAEFAVYSSDGKQIQTGLKTDENGKLTITGLEWGDYYLKETTAPDGYIISAENIEFTINADNDAGRELDFIIENEQKPAYATLIKYEKLENGEETETPLRGAVYELYDTENNLLGTYITDKNGKIYAEDLTFGSYYFKETIAPKGYKLDDTPISFEVNSEHTSVSTAWIVKAYNQRKLGRVTLKKADDEGKAVEGAVYGLFDAKTDKQIAQDRTENNYTDTTDQEGYIDFDDLYWGEYYLKELKAPTGYALSNEKITFTIDENHVSKRILLNAKDNRLKGSVELVKWNTDETKTLAGAVYTLCKNDSSEVGNFTTDENGKIRVDNLEWGSYYFIEKTAPAGYGLSPEKIRFSVNYLTAGKTQGVTATDPEENYKLTVSKKIKISDIVFTHGNPTFTFKVVGGDGHTYYQTVTFSETYLNDYLKDHEGAMEIEASVTFAGLEYGHYTVTEVETNRYETDSISSPNGTVNGKESVEFDIEDTDEVYKATFINEKTSNSGTSHSSQLSNILNRERKLTGVSAVWKGADTIITADLDYSSLEVWAIYDDDTKKQLAEGEYTATHEKFSGSGYRTVDVSYTDGGRTRNDSFTINIDVPDPFTWTITSEDPYTFDGIVYDGTATITGYLNSESRYLNIPVSVTGWVELTDYSNGANYEHPEYAGKKYKVTGVTGKSSSISMYGIENCDTLNLPDGLITIGDYTFKNRFKSESNECSLDIPNTVTKIGKDAFRNCAGFTGGLEIPNSVTEIGTYAFSACSGLNGTLKISDKLTVIKDSAFRNCSKLTGSLEIPDGVTQIQQCAFENCSGFNETLTISDSVKTIRTRAFAGSAVNMKFTGELILPDSLETIDSYAFYNCSGFTGSLTIPEKVTSIKLSTFENCSGFDGTLTIGNKVQTIESKAFYKCTGFTGGLEIHDSVTSIGDYAFTSRDNTTDNTFMGFNGQLKLGNNIQTIGNHAFNGCSGFTGGLTIPDSVITIGDNAFKQCTGFNNTLTIGDKVETIGEGAFYGCKFTGSLEIPPSVRSIGYAAFWNCTGLNKDLILHEGLQEIGVQREDSSYNDIIYGAFKSCQFSNPLVIPDSVTAIGTYAFQGCNKLTSLTIGDGVITIGERAFQTCTKLTALNIGNNVKTIEKYAFSGCNNTSLTTLKIPDSVETIGYSAFYNCKVKELTLGRGVKSIEGIAFKGCTNLKGKIIAVPAGATVADNAFEGLGVTLVYS